MNKATLSFALSIAFALSCDSSGELSSEASKKSGAVEAASSDAAATLEVAGSGADSRADAAASMPAGSVDAMISRDAEVDVISGPDAASGDASIPSETASAPDAAVSSEDVPESERCYGPPGLYSDGRCQVLAPGVRRYTPQFALWTDGAEKERHVYLPPRAKIDTRDPNRWAFPAGTVFYKTFALNGVRVETRVFQKVGPGIGYVNWNVDSYAWSADQRSVTPASVNGARNVIGTPHDIPSAAQCRQCHNMTGLDPINGFGAIQLNHTGSELTLEMLLAEGRLVNGNDSSQPNVSVTNATLPGDATARAGLGYLHANCGHCHGGPTPRAMQQLWSVVGVTQLTDTPIFKTAICHCLEDWTGRANDAGTPYELRVAPGHSEISGIIGRMSRRGAGEQMPPVGTSIIDPAGIAAVSAFIGALDGTTCNAAPPNCSPPDAEDAGAPPAGDDDAGEPDQGVTAN